MEHSYELLPINLFCMYTSVVLKLPQYSNLFRHRSSKTVCTQFYYTSLLYFHNSGLAKSVTFVRSIKGGDTSCTG